MPMNSIFKKWNLFYDLPTFEELFLKVSMLTNEGISIEFLFKIIILVYEI